ncbi:MAG: ammonium transporter [Nitrososphaerota archaeon]
MVTKNRNLAILLVAVVAVVSITSIGQAYAQMVTDTEAGMIYTGNAAECWMDSDADGVMDTPCAIDSGHTAFVYTATTLVLWMTPGVAFFYGGLSRSKNAVNSIGMTFIVIGLISLQWVLWGFSIAFGPEADGVNEFASSFDYIGLNKVSHLAPLGAPLDDGTCLTDASCGSDYWAGLIPHQLFAMFQLTFAIITPALIVGALIDRMKFSAFLIFIILWASFVYDPVAHWVWGGGWLGGLDLNPDLSPSFALDFAGGTVVHITSGFSGLAAALVLGRRLGYGKVPMEPHNVPMVVLGASMLWFGWFGFNPGSELAADGVAVSAWVVTNTATAMASITWLLMSWAHTGKPSIVGAASGAVAGLVAITPASGWVGPMASIIIGITAGVLCYAGVAFKNARKWDDALDAWAVHGIGGFAGAVLTGTLASPHIFGGIGAWTGTPEGMEQQAINVIGAISTTAYAFTVTIVILKIMDAIWPGGIRVTPKEEEIGLDLAQHGERAYVNE